MREIRRKSLLALRIIGSVTILLAVWGLCFGSFSKITFTLILVFGIAAGYSFHMWVEHLIEKYKNEYPTEKEKQRLLSLLSMGKWKFIFINGVLLYGIGMTILMVILEIWRRWDTLPFWDQFVSFRIIAVFVLFTIFGIAFGLIMWNGVQKTAQKYSLLENSSDNKK
jgi:hypothetical protein